MRREKLVLVEHVTQNALEAFAGRTASSRRAESPCWVTPMLLASSGLLVKNHPDELEVGQPPEVVIVEGLCGKDRNESYRGSDA